MMTFRLRCVTLCAFALLWGAWTSQAQLASPFTVLSNNSDVKNQKLYVEIMYEKPACGDYQAQFRMVNSKGLDTVVAVDSFLNNPGTYQLSSDGKRLMRPQAGGYRLRFGLPPGSTPADSLRVCVDAYKMSYRCEGCAAGGSDAIFGPADIDLFCPYSNTANNDLLACYRRESREGNWEAWITDPRDCRPYRIVLMPDNKWWFAQNLTYTKDLVNSGDANKGLGGSTAATSTSLFGNYWCPGGLTITSGNAQTNSHNANSATNATLTTGGLTTCNVYGALYTWNTAIRLDGHGMEHTPTMAGATSHTQGICPEGWLLPSDADWGMMLNAVEGCADLMGLAAASPCNHFWDNNSSTGAFGANAAAHLKSTLSAPPHSNQVDATIATATLPAWPWRRADYSGKVSTPVGLGSDKYGFNLLPAGYRHYNPNSGFYSLGNEAYFWTSTSSNNDSRAIHRSVGYKSPTVARAVVEKWSGFSVRCAREALPAGLDISAPDTISYLRDEMAVSLPRQESTWEYTWSAVSHEIGSMDQKVTFSANGTSAAHSANAELKFDKADVGKSFTLKLTVTNGTNTKTVTKKIYVAALTVSIKINPYSVGGVVTATAHVAGGGKYAYAWGDGSQTFAQDNTSGQALQTGAGSPQQTKTWRLKVKDLRTGTVSAQVAASYTHPAIPAGVTFCSACAHNGSQHVDMWLAPIAERGTLLTSNSASPSQTNAMDIHNGRQNTQRIKAGSYAGTAISTCLQKGAGWYMPAAEEYCKIKTANLHSLLIPSTNPGAWLSTVQTAKKDAMGISCWNSGEPSGNGQFLYVGSGYLIDDNDSPASQRYILCVWRPEN
ncbi:MAG: hypothetical protein LBG47_00420 [Prevotellaceae bacterium]|jgi:uncharacterized protein (TIGR02145 family)|nr:hypothetical protein [Prevotellaceae bacterium]